jgi:hypothetical protein
MADEPQHEEEVDAVEVEEVTPAGSDIVPSAGLAPAPAPSQGGELATLWNTRNPAEIVKQASEVATALKGVIDQQGLAVALGGKKKHVEIEGWQTAATLLGLQAMTVSTARVHPQSVFQAKATRRKWGKVDGVRKVVEEEVTEFPVEGWSWEAVAEVRTMDGRLVGRGEAICSREEENWWDSSDSAVKGMAQTRAQSRALRQALGFIVGLAGYQTAPAEEVKANGGEEQGATPVLITDGQKKALNAALMWLLPEDEAKRIWGLVKARCGGEFWAVVADALTLTIDARKALDEPAEEEAPKSKSKDQERREARKQKADEKAAQDAAEEGDAPAPDEED